MKKIFGFGAFMLLVTLLVSSCEPQQVPADKISIDKELALFVDSTYQLEAVLVPENATGTINWSSSDTAVAQVDKTGLVKGIQKGTAYVTANLGNAVAVCNVIVHNNPVLVDLSMLEVVQKKCTVAVNPSDKEGYYYCGYAPKADVEKVSDANLTKTIMSNMKATIEQYAAYGYNLTLKDFLQQGAKNLIASPLTANSDYVIFAFGIDVDSEVSSPVVTRLEFKTKEVVPSSMTFTIEFDSIAVKQKVSTKGDTTYTYNGYFKCTPSNETETYVFTGVTPKALDSLYNNDPMQYLTEMEAYYDKNYGSQGGFEGVMVKAGTRDIYASNMKHGDSYVLMAVGYTGGFSTGVTTFNYTFVHPDSAKNAMPAYRTPRMENAMEIDMTDFRGVYFPGICR